MPGWANSDRRETLPANWKALRQVVLNRAKNRCESVHKSGRRCWDKAVAVDHVVPHCEGGGDELENLAAICQWHHNRKSSAEGGRAEAARIAAVKKDIRREPEKHPGLIAPDNAKPREHRGF